MTSTSRPEKVSSFYWAVSNQPVYEVDIRDDLTPIVFLWIVTIA